MEENLQGWPFLSAQKPPCARRENESIPSGYSERADEEVLVRGEMGREVEVRGEDVGEVGGAGVGGVGGG